VTNAPPHERFGVLTLAVLAGFSACTAKRADPERSLFVQHDAAPQAVASAAAEPADVSSLPSAPEVALPAILAVPRAAGPVVPTGHFNVKVWGGAVNTHTLLDAAGKGAVPVSEARFLWTDGQLYFFFYAGDLDLEIRNKKHDGPVWNDDSVVLTFFGTDDKKRVIQVSPTGIVADGLCPKDASSLEDGRCDLKWESHVRVGTDYDGTINKLGDFDEEWAVEAAVPFRSIGLEKGAAPGTKIAFSVSRCEMAYDGRRACGIWGTNERPAEMVLEP
jgi:hypothetical protein